MVGNGRVMDYFHHVGACGGRLESRPAGAYMFVAVCDFSSPYSHSSTMRQFSKQQVHGQRGGQPWREACQVPHSLRSEGAKSTEQATP
jgi:hypothetical protein